MYVQLDEPLRRVLMGKMMEESMDGQEGEMGCTDYEADSWVNRK